MSIDMKDCPGCKGLSAIHFIGCEAQPPCPTTPDIPMAEAVEPGMGDIELVNRVRVQGDILGRLLESMFHASSGGRFSDLAHTLLPTLMQELRKGLVPATASVVVERCSKPPKGWRCTRPYGHSGSCATVLDVDALTEAGGMIEVKTADDERFTGERFAHVQSTQLGQVLPTRDYVNWLAAAVNHQAHQLHLVRLQLEKKHVALDEMYQKLKQAESSLESLQANYNSRSNAWDELWALFGELGLHDAKTQPSGQKDLAFKIIRDIKAELDKVKDQEAERQADYDRTEAWLASKFAGECQRCGRVRGKRVPTCKGEVLCPDCVKETKAVVQCYIGDKGLATNLETTAAPSRPHHETAYYDLVQFIGTALGASYSTANIAGKNTHEYIKEFLKQLHDACTKHYEDKTRLEQELAKMKDQMTELQKGGYIVAADDFTANLSKQKPSLYGWHGSPTEVMDKVYSGEIHPAVAMSRLKQPSDSPEGRLLKKFLAFHELGGFKSGYLNRLGTINWVDVQSCWPDWWAEIDGVKSTEKIQPKWHAEHEPIDLPHPTELFPFPVTEEGKSLKDITRDHREHVYSTLRRRGWMRVGPDLWKLFLAAREADGKHLQMVKNTQDAYNTDLNQAGVDVVHLLEQSDGNVQREADLSHMRQYLTQRGWYSCSTDKSREQWRHCAKCEPWDLREAYRLVRMDERHQLGEKKDVTNSAWLDLMGRLDAMSRSRPPEDLGWYLWRKPGETKWWMAQVKKTLGGQTLCQLFGPDATKTYDIRDVPMSFNVEWGKKVTEASI